MQSPFKFEKHFFTNIDNDLILGYDKSVPSSINPIFYGGIGRHQRKEDERCVILFPAEKPIAKSAFPQVV